MDLYMYYKEKIMDELDGAREYAIAAFNIKPMDMTSAKTYIDMAIGELGHASKLYAMFEQYYQTSSKSVTNMPDCISDTINDIVTYYTTNYAEVKNMVDLFTK